VNIKPPSAALASAGIALLLASGLSAGTATITVAADQPGVKVSPSLWGIFYEEINHAGDGGIYAELVQNRAFEEAQPAAGSKMVGDQMVTPKGFKHGKWYKSELHAWSVIEEGGAKAAIALDDAHPLNDKTPHSMRLEVQQTGGRAGVANEGYWGMSVREGEAYDLSFYARTEGEQTVAAQLESADGKQTYAKAEVTGVSGNWKRYASKLVATGTDPQARLALCVAKPGTIWFDVVSLFPKTFKDRPNGLREDLVKQLQGLQPGFLRFPGGCVVEGVTLENRIQWKNTIGDIARRPGRWDLWGYHNTEGMGFHEYLQLCEDLNSEPMYVINAGMSCAFRSAEEVTKPEELKAYVQDAMDALEYANGPATSKWGAERAKNGHPEPFKIKYVEIGNENWGAQYFKNYRPFYDAIKAKYPDIITIADCPIPGQPVEIIDEHYYVAPPWFFANEKKYDSYDRSGPKIYVGEYAVNNNVGSGNLLGALSEAAFMIGMERNSDVVVMASYAPLFENVNNRAWAVNLIRFDSARSTGRSSYHVQTLFNAHRPDVTLATQVEEPGQPAPKLGGGIGVGTWNTQAEYKDIVVTQGDKTLYRSDFAKGIDGWQLPSGDWKAVHGALRQSGGGDNLLALTGDPSWTDYTMTLKARKLGGSEGFLILFNVKDAQNMAHWNIGGWGNTRSTVEQKEGGANREISKGPDGGIESKRWYDIKVEVAGSKVSCYLDGKLIQTAKLTPPPSPASIYALGGKDEKTGQIIIKALNPGASPLDTTFRIKGAATLKPKARVVTLAGDKPTDENTLDEPTKVVPVESTFEGVAPEFKYQLKPYSLTIFRVDAAR
jgi:alpha-L-arabinofuranosidase